MAASILADAVLAESLGRDHLLPLISLALKPRDLRLRSDDLRLACHRATAAWAGQAVPLAAEPADRPYEVERVGTGRMLRMRPVYAPAIRSAADAGGQAVDLSDINLAVLAGSVAQIV
ncbi:MAG: hypothetical protein ACT4OK_02405 [Gemmobacter sp.]